MKSFNFDYYLDTLKDYIKKYRTMPNMNTYYNNLFIGRWLNTQKRIYTLGKKENGNIIYNNHIIKKENIDKLESLGIDLTYEDKSQKWNIKYNLLREYINKYNDIPLSNTIYNDVNIGAWLHIQFIIIDRGTFNEDGNIIYKSNGIVRMMEKYQYDKIKEIKDLYFNKNRFDGTFEDKVDLLKEYLEENNNALPPQSTVYKGFNLGKWVGVIRNAYYNGIKLEDGSIKYRTVLLTEDRIKLLMTTNILGKFNLCKNFSNDKWEAKFNELVKFLEEHNGNYPSKKGEPSEASLANWVLTQRQLKRRLDENEDMKSNYNYDDYVERMNKLSSINFKWKEGRDYSDDWNSKYEILKEYVEKYNVFPVAGSYYKDYAIGNWLSSQRVVFNNGIIDNGYYRYKTILLPIYGVEKLDRLGMNWIIKEKDFNSKIIDDTEKMNQKRRLLISKLNQLTMINKEFKSKDDIKEIDNKLRLSLK